MNVARFKFRHFFKATTHFNRYHQKVPPEAPQLELKATYGLVAPEEYKVPDPNPLWTADTYKAFEISKNTPPDPVSNFEVLLLCDKVLCNVAVAKNY